MNNHENFILEFLSSLQLSAKNLFRKVQNSQIHEKFHLENIRLYGNLYGEQLHFYGVSKNCSPPFCCLWLQAINHFFSFGVNIEFL